jgi:hypothetical protein
MKITKETIPLIEKALNIKLFDKQIDYLLNNGSYWYGDRGSGKTTAYCIKLALSDGEPLNVKKPFDFCDSPNTIRYSQWFKRFFLDIWNSLKDAGLPVRELTN